MSVRKPQILKGFRDYTPDQMRLRLDVLNTFRTIFERHGFEPIDTPTLEYMEILTGKAGENEKLMYHFLDHGGREVGLRYDLTVPLARYFAMNQQESVVPFKRYHIAPVWRAEKPQRGRGREFWQCDADIVGSPSMLADAEAISVLTESLRAVNLSAAVVLVNHRKLLEAMARLAGVGDDYAPVIFRAIDKLDKIGPDGVKRELTGSGVDDVAAAKVLELVTRSGSSSDLLNAAEQDLEGIPGGREAVTELRELIAYLGQRLVEDHADHGSSLASVDHMEDRSRQAVDRFARDLCHQLQAFAFAMLDAPLHQLAEARRVRPAVELQHDPVEKHAEVSLV